jgi:hypothetical protein
VEDLSDIRLRKRVSSVRPLEEEGRPGGRPPWGDRRARLVLYDEPGYRGSSYTVESAEDRIAFADRAESLRVIGGGRWEVCDGASGRGRCEVFSADEPDLSRYGLRNRIVSVRPVSGYDYR